VQMQLGFGEAADEILDFGHSSSLAERLVRLSHERELGHTAADGGTAGARYPAATHFAN
jgi:hypothetical protein